MKKYQRGNTDALAQLIVVLVIAAVVMMCSFVYQSATREDRVITVEEKMERCKDGDCKYLIYTTSGVFQNTDSLLNMKFDSSDVYGALKVGKTYDVETTGLRIPVLSMYPNIVEFKETH